MKSNYLFTITLESVQLNYNYMAFVVSNKLHAITIPNAINNITITYHYHLRDLELVKHFPVHGYSVDIFHNLVLREYWALRESRTPLKLVLGA